MTSTLSPEILPDQTGAFEIGAGACVQPAVRGQPDRVLPVDRQRHGQSEARAAELLLALDAIDGTAAAVVVGGTERAPGAAAKLARHVQLRRIDRILAAGVAVEEFLVAREPGDARRKLDGPAAERLRHAELGLDRPTVGADIDQPVLVVLAEGRGDREARAHDQILPPGGELGRPQRRRAVEIHCQP
jgi:hypothetical protein